MNSAQRRKNRRGGNLVRKGLHAKAEIDAAKAETARALADAAAMRADIARLTTLRYAAESEAGGQRERASAVLSSLAGARCYAQNLERELEAERAEGRKREARLSAKSEECGMLRAHLRDHQRMVDERDREIARLKETSVDGVRRRLRARSEELHEARTEIQRLRLQLAHTRDPLATVGA